MKLLGIDTSGKIPSVALCDENITSEITRDSSLTHSEVIISMCKQLLEKQGEALENMDGFVVAEGPGSYTGLRIGISAVKAMAYALGKPCVGVSTLKALACKVSFQGKICAVMKARQELYYTALFSGTGENFCRITEDGILSSNDLSELLEGLSEPVMLTGDGAKEFFESFPHESFQLAPEEERLQTASALCIAARDQELLPPEYLNAKYLQPTKAEKDKGIEK